MASGEELAVEPVVSTPPVEVSAAVVTVEPAPAEAFSVVEAAAPVSEAAEEAAPAVAAPAEEVAPVEGEASTGVAEEAALPGDVSLRGFDGQMVLLTWAAFGVAALVLGRVLWRPLLKFLEAREAEIRTSLEEAAQARKVAAEAEADAAALRERADREARAAADVVASAARAQAAELELSTREALAERRRVAEEALAAEREAVLRGLSEQAGGEIARVLEELLPGMLTDEQRQAYQARIAEQIRFD